MLIDTFGDQKEVYGMKRSMEYDWWTWKQTKDMENRRKLRSERGICMRKTTNGDRKGSVAVFCLKPENGSLLCTTKTLICRTSYFWNSYLLPLILGGNLFFISLFLILKLKN